MQSLPADHDISDYFSAEPDENKPWDIKKLVLSLGGESDENGFITFEIFNDDTFNIFEGDGNSFDYKWFYEDIDIRAAARLRDFLNYAVPASKYQ